MDDQTQALCFACRNGNASEVQHLVSAGASINQPGPDGWPPLGLAIFHRHVEIASLLLSWGADFQQRWQPQDFGIQTTTPIHLAAGTGSTVLVDLLVKYGANVNDMSLVDAQGVSMAPLLVARGPAARRLIESGADLSKLDSRGYTALMQAALRNDLEVVEELLRRGVDPNTEAPDRATAIQLVCSENGKSEDSIRIAQALLNSGARFTSTGPRIKVERIQVLRGGRQITARITPLSLAVQRSPLSEIDRGVIHQLLEAGMDLDHEIIDPALISLCRSFNFDDLEIRLGILHKILFSGTSKYESVALRHLISRYIYIENAPTARREGLRQLFTFGAVLIGRSIVSLEYMAILDDIEEDRRYLIALVADAVCDRPYPKTFLHDAAHGNHTVWLQRLTEVWNHLNRCAKRYMEEGFAGIKNCEGEGMYLAEAEGLKEVKRWQKSQRKQK